MKHLARIISRIFEPLVILPIILVFAGVRAGLTEGSLLSFLTIMAALFIVPVIVFRVWLVARFHLDWDISNRKKRIGPLIVLLLFLFGALILVNQWHNVLLTDMFVQFFLWLVGFLVITLFWKISGHTGVITLAFLLLLEWYGWQMWPILLAISLVTWARVVGKNHTLGQAIGGIVYSSLLHEIWKSILR